MIDSLKNKAVDWFWNNEIKVLFLIWLTITMVGCTTLYKKYNIKEDNAVEELVEQVIESKTGLDVDLSPSSIEN